MAPEVILSGDVDHQEYDARADVWFVTQIVLTTVMRMMMIHDAPKFCRFFNIVQNPFDPLPFEHMVKKFKPLRGHLLGHYELHFCLTGV